MLSLNSADSIEKAWASRFTRWRAYAIALTGNGTDAEDVIQEAVARTMQAGPRLATERDAFRYVLAAVRSAAVRLFRSRGRLLPLVDGDLDEVDVASGPLRMLLDWEHEERQLALQQKALNAVRELDAVKREVVELMILREPPMKLRQVAELQGAPISTVHSRLTAALRELGSSLRGHEEY